MAFNKVVMMGNLTEDPELKYTPSGVSTTTFSIAVGRRFAKESDEIKTDFFRVVAWRQTAEFVTKYFHKGKAILICGAMQNRSWTDKDGQKHYVTEIIADEATFAGNAEQRTEAPHLSTAPQESNSVYTRSAPEQTAPVQAQGTVTTQSNYTELSTEDDFPF